MPNLPFLRNMDLNKELMMSNKASDYLNKGVQYLNEEKYVEAIEQFDLALKCEDATIEQRVINQYWLGVCYFKQDLFDKAQEYLNENVELAKQIKDEQNRVIQQVYNEYWLGYCYWEQAKKEKAPSELWHKAQGHFKKLYKLAEQITDKQERVNQQFSARFSLGACYFEQAKQEGVSHLWEKVRAYFEQSYKLAEQITDERARVNKQLCTQFCLGTCYFEQVKREGMSHLLEKARGHFEQCCKLAEEITDKKEQVNQKINIQLGLGFCYFEQAKREGVPYFWEKAHKHFQEYGQLAKQLINEPLLRLELAYLYQFKNLFSKKVIDEYKKYLGKKQSSIKQKLPQKFDDKLQDAIAQILAVLNITPVELHMPLAHYTNPTVCEKLLGLNSNNSTELPSPMRMNSCTYMNDPTEGQSLLALLNMQDLSLKNKIDFEEHKPYNAFFSCFSKRVNDLNQFRLYGKEDGVEASGCCLLFNKTGDWLQYTDISKSFLLGREEGQFNQFFGKANILNNQVTEPYPLYQVAYIAYDDEYLPQNVCQISLESNNRTFFVYLPSLFFNTEPDKLRETHLKEGLEKLIKYVSDSTDSAEKNHELLEYVRYLFKDFAFRDEEELRALTVCPLGNKVEYCSDSNGIYVEYGNVQHQIDEIILGTNYEYTKQKRKVEVLRYKLAKSNLKVKVSHSTLPITPPTL